MVLVVPPNIDIEGQGYREAVKVENRCSSLYKFCTDKSNTFFIQQKMEQKFSIRKQRFFITATSYYKNIISTTLFSEHDNLLNKVLIEF